MGQFGLGRAGRGEYPLVGVGGVGPVLSAGLAVGFETLAECRVGVLLVDAGDGKEPHGCPMAWWRSSVKGSRVLGGPGSCLPAMIRKVSRALSRRVGS